MFQQSNFYSSPILATLPSQMIPKSRKDEKWKQSNMDALESLARSQVAKNMYLIENYEMIKGKFIPSHYIDQPEHADMIAQLTKEFNLPSYLRHYDICSQVINTLSGELQTRPDTFRVKSQGEHVDNEYIRMQTDLLHKYVNSKIEAEVARRLLEAGIDENGAQNLPPDQVEQYQQMVDQARQQMTPPQIQQYMQTDWLTAGEIWGQHQLELDRKRFRQIYKEKLEFEDMLVADRCFRHFYLTANGYNQETWNPIHVFYHCSPDIPEAEEGDYIGRGFWLSNSAIINRYGHKMTKEQIEALEEDNQKPDKRWNYTSGSEYVFDKYMVPFQGWPAYDMMKQTGVPHPELGISQIDTDVLSAIHGGTYYGDRRGHHFVAQGYWRSQKKIGKVTYIDPETGLLTKTMVDEDIVIPSSFKQLDSSFDKDTNEPDTVVWTYIDEIWGGTKLCVKSLTGMSEDIYLDIEPLPFQFCGDNNPYSKKLPVCGGNFSIRNSQPMSLVDHIKPHQIGYNVAMNQAYQEMQKDVGKFIVMDVNMFADKKDWGGSQAYEKFIMMAKELGVTVADTSPGNTQGSAAASSGHLPKEIDLDASARILSRLRIAEAFEGFALKQVGFNEYRLGQQGNNATATGVNQGTARSFAQTESLFTNFTGYLQRCHKMNLNIAQYVQSQEQDVTVSYVKSDLSRAFIKLAGAKLLDEDLHIYVWNSQEELRQLEVLRQLAMSNNTMGANFDDLAEVLTSNSPAEIKLKLKLARQKAEAAQQQQVEMQQQAQQAAQAIEQAKLEMEERHFEEEWGKDGTRERIAYMNTFSRQQANLQDTDTNSVPDIFEYEKFDQKSSIDDEKIQVQKERNRITRENHASDTEVKLKALQVSRQNKMDDVKIQNKELESVKIMKDKDKEKSTNASKKK